MFAMSRSNPRWSRVVIGLSLVVTLSSVLGWSGLTITRGETPAAVAGLADGTPSPSMPPDTQVPTYGECTATPRDFEDAMALLRAQLYDPSVVIPPSWATDVRVTPTGPVQSYELPDGPAPTAEQVDEVSDLLGRYLNCPTSAQAIGYWTDDNLIRSGLYDEGSGYLISGLWQEANPEPDEPVPSYPEPIIDGNGSAIEAPLPPQEYKQPDLTGTSIRNQLYGFRMIDDTHLGAYVEITEPLSFETTTIGPEFDQTGFVVFERLPDGRWLIDEFVSPYEIIEQRLSSEAEATPSA